MLFGRMLARRRRTSPSGKAHPIGGALGALTVNVVRGSFRNRTALFFTLGLAFLFMFIFGELFTGGGHAVTIGVVNADSASPLSTRFVATLRSISGVTVETGSASVENDQLQRGKVDVVVTVPAGFDSALRNPAAPPATLTVRQASLTSPSASVADQILGNVTNGFAAPGTPRVTVAAPTLASTNPITNIDYFLPSMIGYIILQSGINYVAISLVELRVRKVLRRLRSTPLRPATILTAQVAGGALTVLLQIVVLVIVGRLLFGAHNYGNWLVAAVPILLGTGAFVGIGFLLTSAARTSESARALASMIALPMMFLTGIFFPVEDLPTWLQSLVHILPLTWLNDALHQVMNDGVGLGAIAGDCLVLGAWAVVTLVVATLRFRWD